MVYTDTVVSSELLFHLTNEKLVLAIDKLWIRSTAAPGNYATIDDGDPNTSDFLFLDAEFFL